MQRHYWKWNCTALGASLILLSAGIASADPFEGARTAYQKQDFATALRLFRSLADQGNAAAQADLGVMYGGGEGVPQNFAEAVKWFRKAADQGDAAAQFNLGIMYRDGKGVPRMWLSLAAAQLPASKETLRRNAISARDFVAFKLTTARIAKAQKMAEEWKPKVGQ